MLIFELSKEDRIAKAQIQASEELIELDANFLRKSKVNLPQVSELQVVRHYTNLSRKNYCIDTNFYPLGSCTMKYNPRGVHNIAGRDTFLNRHPLTLPEFSQGFLQILFELQEMLCDITGMQAVSLSPMAGAQGEFVGVALIKAYHDARGDNARCEIIVPDAAHGTNPASAVMCGYKAVELPTKSDGDVDLDKLKQIVGPKTAGIMLTNPSTLGVFERNIVEVQKIIHEAGGLSYYDGANLNAILGKVRPGDMGFDVIHMNLHKTFATPHGGGGPGSGPVGINKRLLPYMPIPSVIKDGDAYRFTTRQDMPETIGRLNAFMGNAGILLRAYFYIRILGHEGLHRVAEFATLNANYLMKKLAESGFDITYPDRMASHEFILSLKSESKKYGITAMDFAKRLLDYGVHAPTTYFPLLIPECLLIEPTETESPEELDNFILIMQKVLAEAKKDASLLTNAPQTTTVGRLDDVKAARELDISYSW